MKISKIYRIYQKDYIPSSGLYILSAENAHYLSIVLRLRGGDKVRVFNEKQGEYLAKVYSFSKSGYSIEILEKFRDLKNISHLTIALSLIKSDRLMLAVEKAVELGVTEIAPLICNYSQFKNINMSKVEKTIIEAVRQCERLDLPALNPPLLLQKFNFNKYDLVIYCNENEDELKTLKSLDIASFKNIAIIIGPEGGFSEEELVFLASKATSISLGNNVLRAETAAICAISQVQLLRN